MNAPYDIVIVGAGPVGVSTALHARRRGLRALVIDKGVVANHLLEFPIGMAFFTPRHSLELLGIPLDSGRQHATREEIISYYGRMSHDSASARRATAQAMAGEDVVHPEGRRRIRCSHGGRARSLRRARRRASAGRVLRRDAAPADRRRASPGARRARETSPLRRSSTCVGACGRPASTDVPEGPRGTKPLFMDLASPTFVELAAKIVRKASTVSISEMLPDLDDLWLIDGEGRHYTTEFRIVAIDPEPWAPA